MVLEAAAATFAREGYEGASIATLTRDMGISAQSLYAAFGSKAALYDAALDWYAETNGDISAAALDGPDPLATLADLLVSEARRYATDERFRGCMISVGALGCSEDNAEIERTVAARREGTIALVASRLKRAERDGHLADGASPGTLARYFGALLQGMSVQARDGVSAPDLIAVAVQAGDILLQARSRR